MTNQKPPGQVAHLAADKAITQKLQLQRSPAWGEVEKAFRAAHPKCVACGETQQVNIHHLFPFHYVVLCGRPDLELDPRNLMTLCVRQDQEHHLLLGHLDDFESYNPDVQHFVTTYSGKNQQAISADPAWKKAVAAKPKHVGQMSPADKAAFKTMLDGKIPPNPAVVAKAAAARKKLA